MIFLITRRTFTTGLLLPLLAAVVSLGSATFDAGSLPSRATTILLEEEVRSSDDDVGGLFSFVVIVVPISTVVDFSLFSLSAGEGVRTGEAREEPFLMSFGSTDRSGVTERREEGFNDNRTPIGAPDIDAVLPLFWVPPSAEPLPRM
uniref:Putative secreted peptide n=1 Tax=Anopheles braziliensis TaxID=58242 RepID=A0A2M3ZRJ8_9DIPT